MEEPVYVPEFEDVRSEKVEDANTLLELIKIHDSSFDRNGKLVDSRAYWDSKAEIRNRLYVPSIDNVNKALDALLRRVERLEKMLKEHRHRVDVAYSGRAEM